MGQPWSAPRRCDESDDGSPPCPSEPPPREGGTRRAGETNTSDERRHEVGAHPEAEGEGPDRDADHANAPPPVRRGTGLGSGAWGFRTYKQEMRI